MFPSQLDVSSLDEPTEPQWNGSIMVILQQRKHKFLSESQSVLFNPFLGISGLSKKLPELTR